MQSPTGLPAALQDAGNVVAALCQAAAATAGRASAVSTELLRSRIAHTVKELHSKQESIRLTPTQLGVVLSCLMDTLVALGDDNLLVHDVVTALAVVLCQHGGTDDVLSQIDTIMPVSPIFDFD